MKKEIDLEQAKNSLLEEDEFGPVNLNEEKMDRIQFTANTLPPTEMPIDEGIKTEVHILWSNGIDTIESCQGGPGHPCPDPFVRFNGNLYEGFRAYAIARTYGLDVFSIAYEYADVDGMLERPCWVMYFRKTKDPKEQP